LQEEMACKSAVVAVMVAMFIALIMQCHVVIAAEAPSPAPTSGNTPSSEASMMAGLVLSALAFFAGFAWL
jgi:hypothetical protein